MGTYMAKKQVEGMLAPLLEEDENESSMAPDDADSSSSSEVETVKQGPLEKLKSTVVYLGLGLGLVASAGAMVLSPAIPIFIMGGLTIANIPYAAIKERSMGKLPALRAMNDKLREDANKLEDNVDHLSEEIDLLEPEADKAAAIEEELRDIASSQQVNVDHLVELAKENGIILQKMRENLRQCVVQDITGIVINSDKDNDHSIDQQEARMLALKIRLQLREHGVVFDGDKFILAIGKDATVPGVIQMVQKLMLDGGGGKDDNEESGSDSDDDSVFDMFHLEAREPGVLGMSLMKCNTKKSRQRGSCASSFKRSRVDVDNSAGSDGSEDEEEGNRW